MSRTGGTMLWAAFVGAGSSMASVGAALSPVADDSRQKSVRHKNRMPEREAGAQKRPCPEHEPEWGCIIGISYLYSLALRSRPAGGAHCAKQTSAVCAPPKQPARLPVIMGRWGISCSRQQGFGAAHATPAAAYAKPCPDMSTKPCTKPTPEYAVKPDGYICSLAVRVNANAV